MNALNVAEYTHSLGLQAKTASALMAKAPAAIKNKALLALARLLRERRVEIRVNAPGQRDLVSEGSARYYGPALRIALAHLESQVSRVKRKVKGEGPRLMSA